MPFQFYTFLLASPQLMLGYALACMLVGWYGKDTRIGYWGFLILSFVLTPFVAFLFIFLSAPAKRRK